jgi:3-dehydroquinate synthetase
MGNVSDSRILNVELGERSYPIYIGDGFIADCSRWLDVSERVCVITDENVDSLYGDLLGDALRLAEIGRAHV